MRNRDVSDWVRASKACGRLRPCDTLEFRAWPRTRTKHISEETERQRSAQFGRIAAWTEPQQPKRPMQDDEREDEAEAS